MGYGYDAAGNVTSMSDGLGATSYAYDVLNRLDTRTRNGRMVDYGYNANNQVETVSYWGRGSVAYGYDNASRLTSLTPWGGAATSYTYRSSGLLAAIQRPNSVATSYSYDTASRLTGLQHVQGGATILNNMVYGMDANGNRDWMTDIDGLTDYVYDAVTYPAIPGGPPAATIDYTMDEVGNRTGDGSTTYGHDASDRITNAGFSYDTNGNLLSDGAKSYEYDAANRLTKVISGSVTITYAYDGWGNLILESSNGITTEYVLDENAPLARVLGEVRSDGAERLYAYGPEGFTAQKTVGGGIEYPLLDGLGSVRHLTDGTGNLILSRSYDVYGAIRHSSGTGITRLGFTGELQDALTGLVYLRARHYHPVLGRFLQRDSFAGSIGRPQSLNRYTYTENNPANYTDPSGHCPWCLAAGGGALTSALWEFGQQVRQNYQNGLTGSDAWTTLDYTAIGEAAATGALSGLAGWGVGGLITKFGGGLLARLLGNFFEGALTDGLTGVLDNWLKGCAWNNDLFDRLWRGGLSGLAGGAFGEMFDKLSNKLMRPLTSKLDELADGFGGFWGSLDDFFCNSFSAETPVATDKGEEAISEIRLGDLVLAYHEETGATGYYTVTDLISHVDASIVLLTISGETLETTAEHPFYVMESAPWLRVGEVQGRWVDASDLAAGDRVRQADGTTGVVQAVAVVQRSQTMYNLTVAEAHTFFVGEQQWLVHNADCGYWGNKLSQYEKIALDKFGHLDAAKRELAGEVVARKPDGTPFDHVTEVRDVQRGLMNMIQDIQRQLDTRKLNATAQSEMQDLLSRASRALDYTEKYVPR